MSSGTLLKTWQAGTANDSVPVMSLAYSPDGRWLTGAAQGRAGIEGMVWDARTGRLDKRIKGLPGWNFLSLVVYSPHGETLALCGVDVKGIPATRLWDTAAGRLHPATLQTQFAAFSPDGKTLAGTSPDCLALWDAGTGREEAQVRGETNLQWSVAYSPDGKTIATGSTDDSIKLFDVATGRSRRIVWVARRVPWELYGPVLVAWGVLWWIARRKRVTVAVPARAEKVRGRVGKVVATSACTFAFVFGLALVSQVAEKMRPIVPAIVPEFVLDYLFLAPQVFALPYIVVHRQGVADHVAVPMILLLWLAVAVAFAWLTRRLRWTRLLALAAALFLLLPGALWQASRLVGHELPVYAYWDRF